MKVYISSDLEGVCGVSKFSQINVRGSSEFLTSMEQAYNELNACIEGLLRAGVDLITVNDAHGAMVNLNVNKINDRVELISGKPKLFSMMAGLDSSYSAVILHGYHAMAMTPNACLSHTFHERINCVKINNRRVGEAYINALFAATRNVPIAFVTGDKCVCDEVYDQIGDIPRFSVKESLSFGAVICKPKGYILSQIEELVYQSITNPTNWIINQQVGPYVLEIELYSLLLADLAEIVPGVNRISERVIRYDNDDFDHIYKMIQVVSMIALCEDIYK